GGIPAGHAASSNSPPSRERTGRGTFAPARTLAQSVEFNPIHVDGGDLPPRSDWTFQRAGGTRPPGQGNIVGIIGYADGTVFREPHCLSVHSAVGTDAFSNNAHHTVQLRQSRCAFAERSAFGAAKVCGTDGSIQFNPRSTRTCVHALQDG